MIVDVTKATLIILMDECLSSLVVRTANKAGQHPGIAHYSMSGRREVVKNIPPSRVNGIWAETQIPIEACQVGVYGERKVPESLERFECPTVRRIKDNQIVQWRPIIEVKHRKDDWFISVQDEGGTELAALVSKTLMPGAIDSFPIEKIVPVVPGQIPFEDETRWTRL